MSDVGLISQNLKDQKYVTRFWAELTETQQNKLAEQIKTLDLASAIKSFEESAHIYKADPANLKPVPDSHRESVNNLNDAARTLYNKLGLEAVAKGEVAALVLAGGQASRLGSACPKGCLALDLHISPCDSLLGIQAAKIAVLQKRAREANPGCDGRIQWVIMTSKSTEAATREHLEKVVPEAGLDWDQVTIFSQAEIPAFDFEGNVFMASKDSIVTSPNGNGGIYSALSRHLPELKKRGVKYFHVYCIDNILCKVADPLFVGYGIDKNADVVAKCVAKRVGELVGSVCLDNGKPRVTEYSELGAELAEKKTEDGTFLFGDGSIANHFFTMVFLDSFCSPYFHLPYHRALKKIAYVNDAGELVKPEKPNGIKLEQFIFDVFEKSNSFYIWTVEREEEFAPLKNAEAAGVDCLSTCRNALAEQSRKWLMAAGAVIQTDSVFVRSGRSYDGEFLTGSAKSDLAAHFVVSSSGMVSRDSRVPAVYSPFNEDTGSREDLDDAKDQAITETIYG